MTFATEKEKAASERYMLVRLEPARDLAALFTSLGGGLYSAPMPFKPSQVFKNGEALIKDNATPTLNDHYYWDGTNLVCKFSVSPSNDVVTAFYYLHFTGSIWREAYSKPGDSGTDFVSWEPRIIEYPGFTQSVEDLLAGVFSISGLELSLINADNGLNKYFTDNDSFYQKKCDIWLGISDSVLQVYSGVMVACSLSNELRISVLDRMNVSNNTALMRDSESECFINTTTYPNAMLSDVGKVVPFILAKYSKRESVEDSVATSVRAFKPAYEDSFFKAYCTNYSTTISSATNRNWLLARCRSIKKQSFGTIVRALTTGGLLNRTYFYFSSYSNLYVGQPIRWNEGGTDYYGCISLVGDHLIGPDTYNVAILTYNSAASSTSSVMTANYCMSVFARTTDLSATGTQPNSQFSETLFEGQHYTVTETNTTGGNKKISITLTSTMETFVAGNHFNFDGLTKFNTRSIDPTQDGIYYCIFTDTNMNHSRVIEDILADMGVDSDLTSITAAESDLDKDVHMMVGKPGDSTLPTYSDVLNKIMSCTLGFLAPVSDGKIGYFLFKKPNPSTTANDDLVDNSIYSDLSVEVQYQDIYSAIVATNDMINIRWIGAEYGGGTTGNIDAIKSKSLDDQRARYLHGVSKVYYIDYVLDDFNDTLDDILSVISNRKAIYSFKTATKNLNHFIGKDLYLVSAKTLGVNGNSKIKLLANSIDGKTASLTCHDLLGLERT